MPCDQGRTEERQLAMRLQLAEAFRRFNHACGDPSERHHAAAPPLHVARDTSDGAHHVLGAVRAGQRATKFHGKLQNICRLLFTLPGFSKSPTVWQNGHLIRPGCRRAAGLRTPRQFDACGDRFSFVLSEGSLGPGPYSSSRATQRLVKFRPFCQSSMMAAAPAQPTSKASRRRSNSVSMRYPITIQVCS